MPTPRPPPVTKDATKDAGVEVVEGVVTRITFANEETGFHVLRVRPQPMPTRLEKIAEAGLITVVGKTNPVAVGESIRAVGPIEHDARHGAQLRAQVLTTALPETAAGIERYLGGGIVKGIGRRTAQKIVAKFGARTMHVLDHEPSKLHEVPGLSGSRADLLAAAWKEQRVVRELMVFLSSMCVPPSLAQRIHKRYRDQAIDVVRRSPYRLALEIWGVGFKSADAIAQKVGISKDDPQRAQAGVLHVLQTLAEEGHTVSPRAIVQERAARLLEGSLQDVRDEAPPDVETLARVGVALDALLEASLAVEEPEGVTHAPLAAHEEGLARAIASLLSSRPDVPALPGVDAAIARFSQTTSVTLAPAQRAAIELIAKAPFAVVTGGPGVGKTTVVRAILSLLEGARLRTVLAAPTGRAAKRMAEATGREAMTIHRLLEVDPRKQRFSRDEHNPIDAQALVVDEASMVDVPLAHALMRATAKGTRVILVGDVDQLPSIGPGAVLRDVIESGVVPTVRLTEVFRQAGSSRIVQGAHAILRGEPPTPSGAMGGARSAPSGELFLVERAEPEDAARTIVEIVESRIPRAFSLDPRRDVQVLVPMVRGVVGTRALNVDLQARLNPPREGGAEARRGQTIFRVGDRVMQMRNDYDREVWNGDVGFVQSIRAHDDEGDDDKTRLTVRLEEGREVAYEDAELDELTLAYACTVHKAQGSEYPAVVIGLVNQHYVMLARKLLYTAVTRAKKLVVIVGSRWALREAVRDARGEERRTTLGRRLRTR